MEPTKTTHTFTCPKGFRRSVTLIALIAIASGVVHGGVDGRWGSSSEIQSNVELLESFPSKIGDWVLLEEEPLPASVLEVLQCHGHVGRLYKHSVSGHQLNMVLLYGPRGPMAVHTPEVCYPGQGVQQIGNRSELVVTDGNLQHTFWQVGFKQGDQPRTEVTYAWADGSSWVAAKYPRIWPVPRLFKIQIAATPNSRDGEDFLKGFVSQWDHKFKS